MPLRLVVRHLLAHPVRSFLTFASVAVAVFLLCVLQATRDGLTAAVDEASSERLWVQSAVSLFVNLPLSYEGKIETVPGVADAVRFQWFGGVYQDAANFFAQFAVDPESLRDAYPELEIVEGSYEDFARERTGAIVGRGLVEKYGFQVGDRVPLIGTIFARTDGSPWEMTVRGVYRSQRTTLDENTLFFHFDYLDESLKAGTAEGPPGSGVFLVRLEDGAEPVAVMASVDALFENGPQRVQTTTEAEFTRQFVSMLGNVPALLAAVGAAVLFAIVFAVLNTMLMAARERTRSIGILKALGFSNAVVFGLLTLEAVVLCVVGGLVGVGLAELAAPGIERALAGQIPDFSIAMETVALGFAIALGVGLLAGLAPAWAAARLAPVEALRSEG